MVTSVIQRVMKTLIYTVVSKYQEDQIVGVLPIIDEGMRGALAGGKPNTIVGCDIERFPVKPHGAFAGEKVVYLVSVGTSQGRRYTRPWW